MNITPQLIKDAARYNNASESYAQSMLYASRGHNTSISQIAEAVRIARGLPSYAVAKGNAASGSVLYMDVYGNFYSKREMEKNGATVKLFDSPSKASARITESGLKLHDSKHWVQYDECYPVEWRA